MHSSVISYIQQKIISSPKKILILGDMMLDTYSWGNVSRISPEAPIPVIAIEKDEERLGGSANVANNLAHLNVQAYPISIIGQDANAQALIRQLKKANINTDGLIADPTMETICKQRVLTRSQQLLRIDRDSRYVLTKELELALCKKIEQEAKDAAAIIISDYQFGMITHNIVQTATTVAKSSNIPCICDPGRTTHYAKYKGVTTIKPNRTEAQHASGCEITNIETAIEACQIIQTMCEAEFISLSLDKEGILYYKNKDEYQLLPTHTHNIFDVTGAGDMVTSIIACCLGDKQSPVFTLQLANIAASLEVLQFGVAPIEWHEIDNFVKYEHNYSKLSSLPALKATLAKSSSPIIFVNGYFDTITTSLLLFLQKLRSFKGIVVLAINSDKSFQNITGHKPLLSEEQRKLLLSSVNSIDHIIAFDEKHVDSLILELKPSIIVKGENAKDSIPQVELDAITKVGATIEFLPMH